MYTLDFDSEKKLTITVNHHHGDGKYIDPATLIIVGSSTHYGSNYSGNDFITMDNDNIDHAFNRLREEILKHRAAFFRAK